VVLKYVGEHGNNSLLAAAVAVSVPFDLAQCSRRIDQGFSRIYRNRFLRDMRDYIEQKKLHFEQHDWQEKLQVLNDLGPLERLNTFYKYDDQITAPLHGFQGADDYYRQCSSRYYLNGIETPTLILQAYDDPFIFSHSIPEAGELNSQTEMELMSGGGHVGFVSHSGFQPVYWLEQRIPQFLRENNS
ncbi:MAG: hydrolase, partial [Desulfovibrionales bacterium]|nr:hydrolase [Desulfovibrionales bacterium]